MTDTIATLKSLMNRRDVAAYGVVGSTQVAVACLQLGETEKAIKLLLSALADYQVADRRIDEFQLTLKKENASDGNRTAA
jgi:hypothetical protein